MHPPAELTDEINKEPKISNSNSRGANSNHPPFQSVEIGEGEFDFDISALDCTEFSESKEPHPF